MDSPPEEAVNFGKSILVPSVQELAKQPLTKIPPRYARCPDPDPPITDRTLLPSIPVIDLRRLVSGGDGDAVDSELEKLHTACKEWGFFQVENHGVSASLLEQLKKEIVGFFNLPMEEKKKLWQRPENHEGFGQLFVVSEEQKLDWSDMFYITTLPNSLRINELFAKLPQKLRETMEAYSCEVRTLAMTLLGQMAKALKMEEEEMIELFSDGVQSMRMNYYPPCPEPNKALGFTPHSDADALTILFQLNETEGLQVKKDGEWVVVKPLHNAFVVNIGDIMEIVSNGVYRSIEHRATVNSTKERLSIATFYSSNLNSDLGPAHSLVSPRNLAVFRRVPVEKYFKDFFARKLNGEPYIVHTNIYTIGEGGREQQFYLWFDPTKDFHTYSIVWNPKVIILLVDNIPIRVFKNKEAIGVPFPKTQPMRIYSSLWDADGWATQGGLVKTDWSNAPFTSSYRNFSAHARVMSLATASSCNMMPKTKRSFIGPKWEAHGLGPKGRKKLRWVQKYYMIYDYCRDFKRFPQGLPLECRPL